MGQHLLNESRVKLIYTIDEKIEDLSKTGLQNLVVHGY